MGTADEEFSDYMADRWPRLVTSLIALGCESHEAEDVVQTALTRCYSAWPRVSRSDDIDAYVFRAVLNVWSKSRKRHWWRERPTEQLPERTDPGSEDATLTRLSFLRAMAELADDQRAVLVLRHLADLTEAQVAEVLGVPVGTVKSRTSRALARIDLGLLREETS